MKAKANISRRKGAKKPAALDQMLGDIRALADDIGIRFMGTAADARAARYLSGRFSGMGLAPEEMRFPVLGWSLDRPAVLEVSSAGGKPWRIPCYPYVYSASTPIGGARGRVVAAGRQDLFGPKFRPFERPKFRFRKYAVLDDSGGVLAHIVSRDFPIGARAAAWGVMPLPRTTPTVMMSEADGRRFEELVAGGPVTANLSFAATFHTEAVATNVIARIPGSDRRKAAEQILIMAHFDTQYTGPGAVDNASGVAAVLALAEHFAAHPPQHSLMLALYSGEEVGFVGAKYHLASLKESGELHSIRAVLNLDMLACNEPNWIHASEDFLAQESARRAAAIVGVAEKYGSLEIVTPCWPSGDQDPFDDEGIPCVSFTWKGYKYPHTHTPGDTSDKVDRGVLLDSFHLARHVVLNMDSML